MERKEMTPAVENEVKNPVENNKNMNNIIDFASVCGEGTVAQTATVDQQVVNDLFNAFMTIPQEVIVKFRNDNGYLKMAVNMNHRDKFFRSYETFADGKLVENMIGAMRGDRIASLEIYKVEEHPLEASEVDPRINIFRLFLNSTMRCHFDADLVGKNGDRYMCATFNVSYKQHFKFCLKRTEELETIINEFINAALQRA